jgi:hypothetical protein
MARLFVDSIFFPALEDSSAGQWISLKMRTSSSQNWIFHNDEWSPRQGIQILGGLWNILQRNCCDRPVAGEMAVCRSVAVANFRSRIVECARQQGSACDDFVKPVQNACMSALATASPTGRRHAITTAAPASAAPIRRPGTSPG